MFVFNDTRVFPARLLGTKDTGGRVELLLLRKTATSPTVGSRWADPPRGYAKEWSCRSAKDRSPLASFGARATASWRSTFEAEGEVDALIEQAGEVPLPPYIRRAAGDADRARYQTVYARKPGAVAAPTAGLHFTERTLGALEEAGHETAYVTLHVGPGTFRPVQVDTLDEHEMHEEAYEVSEATVAAIGARSRRGRPVVAVGTTVVRTLESSIDAEGQPVAGFDTTRLFIRPPYRFHVVDHLVTNFHLPRSTLLALVMAFAGVDLTRRAYREAAERRYRFYSYGDAMLIRGRAP